jgi:hypothetical protein
MHYEYLVDGITYREDDGGDDIAAAIPHPSQDEIINIAIQCANREEGMKQMLGYLRDIQRYVSEMITDIENWEVNYE